jgi:hypothetical protein
MPTLASPIAGLMLLAIAFTSACSTDALVSPEVPGDQGNVPADPAVQAADVVEDLSVVATSASSVTLGWTEVSDGAGAPAAYRVRYARPTMAWNSPSTACSAEIVGVRVGSTITCAVEGLEGGTEYDFQLMSYRSSSGAVLGEQYSSVARARTAVPLPPRTTGIWISPAEVLHLPMAGPAWDNLLHEASRPCGVVDLADQEQSTNTCIFAKALVFVRTGVTSYRDDVVQSIMQIVGRGTYVGRALSLGRELGTYVVAADLIGLNTFAPTLDASFRAELRSLRTTLTSGASPNLIECNEKRPNNWGAHCGATRAAIAVYLDDAEDLARTAQVFKGYLGDRSSYAGFVFDGPASDLTWQCNPTRPVGINPARCTRSGTLLDGVLPDDQRRAGSYVWPAPQENYVWEALQGLLAQAVILHRAGYPVWGWEDRALLRASRWLHDVNRFPAANDDTWLPHILNRHYGTSFPVSATTRPGKNYGFTDWTHR